MRLLTIWLLGALASGCVSTSYSAEHVAPWFHVEDLAGKRVLVVPGPRQPVGVDLWPEAGPQPTLEERARDERTIARIPAHYRAKLAAAWPRATFLSQLYPEQPRPSNLTARLPEARELDCDYIAVVDIERLERNRNEESERNHDGKKSTTYESRTALIVWLFVFRVSDGQLAYRVRGCGELADSDTRQHATFKEFLCCLLFPPLFLLYSGGYPDFCDPQEILDELSTGTAQRLRSKLTGTGK